MLRLSFRHSGRRLTPAGSRRAGCEPRQPEWELFVEDEVSDMTAAQRREPLRCQPTRHSRQKPPLAGLPPIQTPETVTSRLAAGFWGLGKADCVIGGEAFLLSSPLLRSSS